MDCTYEALSSTITVPQGASHWTIYPLTLIFQCVAVYPNWEQLELSALPGAGI